MSGGPSIPLGDYEPTATSGSKSRWPSWRYCCSLATVVELQLHPKSIRWQGPSHAPLPQGRVYRKAVTPAFRRMFRYTSALLSQDENQGEAAYSRFPIRSHRARKHRERLSCCCARTCNPRRGSIAESSGEERKECNPRPSATLVQGFPDGPSRLQVVSVSASGARAARIGGVLSTTWN